jgi:hypothetical protein
VTDAAAHNQRLVLKGIDVDTGLTPKLALARVAGSLHADPRRRPGHRGRRRGPGLLAGDRTICGQVDVLADSAYGTGAMLAALAAAGHTPLLKPWPTRSLIPGGFSAADFLLDEVAGTLTCPAGHTVALTPINRTAWFGDRCADCVLRVHCTTSPRGRTVLIGEHDALQRAHRAHATDPDFQAAYRRHRPMVEGSIARITRGSRGVPYRSVAKNDAWLHLRAAAINLRPPPGPRPYRHRPTLGSGLLTGPADPDPVAAGAATSYVAPCGC